MDDILAALSPWNLIDAPQETAWITDNVSGEGVVSALVPPVFEAYARVLHPAFAVGSAPVRWAEISSALSRPLEPGTSFAALTGFQGPDYPEGPTLPGTTAPLWDVPPEQGTLDPRSASALASTLESCLGGSADWLFGLWNGYSETAPLRRSASSLHLPDRDFLVFRGSSSVSDRSAVPDRYQAMNLWWAPDRAFFVATDVDLVSTYVGSTAQCLEALKQRADLEVLPVTAETNTWD